MSKPFHELTDAEFDALAESGATWTQVAEKHPQPKWCGYPQALSGLGCWSLTLRKIKSRANCDLCDCVKSED